MTVLGVDVSTRAVDLVLLDDDTNHATHTRIGFPGRDPKVDPRDERVQQVTIIRSCFPRRSWFEEHGVWLIGLEDPVGRWAHTAKALGIITGAVLALRPPEIHVYLISPNEWFRELVSDGKIPRRSRERKDAVRAAVIEKLATTGAWQHEWVEPRIPSDAFDAYGVAYAARQVNTAAEAG